MVEHDPSLDGAGARKPPLARWFARTPNAKAYVAPSIWSLDLAPVRPRSGDSCGYCKIRSTGSREASHVWC